MENWTSENWTGNTLTLSYTALGAVQVTEKKRAGGDAHGAVAFAHGLPVFAFSSELALVCRKCGHPETQGFGTYAV